MRPKLWCNCDVCRSYLTASWSIEFDNLYDYPQQVSQQDHPCPFPPKHDYSQSG
uniref:Uncharacterized protein n=1 Tax=Nelumbo nucifera TaxID=4432 RepID=A0A822XHR7_NELNU|nr:TPA_asm: hypothetical protein HUJ06_020965 [Nelumbo nucifera]